MFKLFKELNSMLKNINESLIKINENVKVKNETIQLKLDKLYSNISEFQTAKCQLETNIYTKDETINQINKEYDYRKRYEECEKENEDILYLIQDYFNYKDKYQVLDLFDEINKIYKIERK